MKPPQTTAGRPGFSPTENEGLTVGVVARSAITPTKEGLGQESRAGSSTFLGRYGGNAMVSRRIETMPSSFEWVHALPDQTSRISSR